MPHSTYFPERMGTAEISPTGSFEAGSYQSLTLTYTAGFFGIDDTGSIKVVHRFASDMGRPQFTDPKEGLRGHGREGPGAERAEIEPDLKHQAARRSRVKVAPEQSV